MPAVLLMLGVAFPAGQTTSSSLEVLTLETSLWMCDVGDRLSSTSCESKASGNSIQTLATHC
jgi:hypothetical protein